MTKRIFAYLIISIIYLTANQAQAQFSTQTPSEQYYNDNLAKGSSLPSTRAGDDDLDPGGTSEGGGGWMGGEDNQPKPMPINSSMIPLLVAVGLYTTTSITRKKLRKQA